MRVIFYGVKSHVIISGLKLRLMPMLYGGKKTGGARKAWCSTEDAQDSGGAMV